VSGAPRALLAAATDPAWFTLAAERTGELLLDHANCEKKAASTALALMFAYPEDFELAARMSRLAREELRHFERVQRVLEERRETFRRLSPSRYAEGLRRCLARREPERQRDLLLCGALIEARSYERFVGLVPRLPAPLAEFYGSLADGLFRSTQYIRHHSVPLYTPEPDVVHEVVGHANSLADPRFAAIYRAAGRAARAATSDEVLAFVSRVFWFSLEFGVLREGGAVKSYGAGLLSSYGEIQQVGDARLLPLDLARMGTQAYDITRYQPLLFCAASFAEVEDVVGGFFDAVGSHGDQVVHRLQPAHA